MKITSHGFAVLDDSKDALLSRYCENSGTLIHDAGIAVHYLPLIKAGDVCIDAGAAIGDHTVAYIQKAGDPKLVHAFECNPLMVECLMHNCPQAYIHPFALSDRHERLWFHHLNENAGASYVDGNEHEGIQVEAVTLDSYELPKVDFIKWDLEGYETKGIRGASKTILRCRPVMMIEVIEAQLNRAGSSVPELLALLKELRYQYRAVIGELGVPPYFELQCNPL